MEDKQEQKFHEMTETPVGRLILPPGDAMHRQYAGHLLL